MSCCICSSEDKACDKCVRTFVTEDLLKKHQTEKHELFCVCGICKQGFQSMKELGDHFKIHELQPNSLEKIYNKTSKKKSETTKKVKQRKRIAHLCSICEESFENADQLSSHISKVHICDICNKGFIEAENFQSHLKDCPQKITNIVNPRDKPFGCCICKESFYSANQLSDHSRIHSLCKS